MCLNVSACVCVEGWIGTCMRVSAGMGVSSWNSSEASKACQMSCLTTLSYSLVTRSFTELVARLSASTP